MPAYLRRAGAWMLGTAALVYAFAYADLTLRARSACREGEKYLGWSRDPSLQKAFYDAEFSRRKAALDRERGDGLGAEDYARKLELLRFSRDERVSESPLKYAYVWFQSACELFSPPRNAWTREGCRRMGEVKAAWQKELKAKGVPYEEYMFD